MLATKRTHLFAVAVVMHGWLLSACKGPEDTREPEIPKSASATASATSSPSAPSSDAGAAVALSRDELSVPEKDTWTPDLTVVSFGGDWVALGANIVNATTGARGRALPPGDARFTVDGAHFVVATPTRLVLGSATSAAEDFAVDISLDPQIPLVLAANGRAGFMAADNALVLVDARKKSVTVVRPAPDAGAKLAQPHWERSLSLDGTRATWVDGPVAYVRDLDTQTTHSFTVPGKPATSAEVRGDVAALQFGDELIIVQASSGVELARRHAVSNVIVGDDGSTVAWEDKSAPIQTLVLLDVKTKKDERPVAIADGPSVPEARQRFRGACGGRAFGLTRLVGARISLDRECTLADAATVDLRTGALAHFESHTPVEQAEEEHRAALACKKAKVTCGGRQAVWLDKGKRVLLETEDHALTLFDTATGRRVGALASSNKQTEANFVPAPNGKTIAGIDQDGVARLWDDAGRVLFEAKVP
jgi:hypothetical protein